MATYKVPQDVEAEDKFLGPLSFKQFLFFGGALITAYLMYLTITSPIPYFVLFILPVFIVCVALAFPWTKDQPTELWLASRIRFLLVKRKRLWDQDDVKDLVTITAPKREVHRYTDGLDKEQVQSRLSALADVMDSRGWAVKNLPSGVDQPATDRLASGTTAVANPVAQHDEPDPLDDTSSPIAQQFSTMITQAEQQHRQATQAKIDQTRNNTYEPTAPAQATSNNPWFLQNSKAASGAPGAVSPADENKLLDKIHKQQRQEAAMKQQSNMKVVQPLSAQQTPTSPPAAQPATTPAQNAYDSLPNPGTMSLSQNNDLNVATIARQANKYEGPDESEVVVPLHNR